MMIGVIPRLTFWGYVLETNTHMLNLILTNKVAKTPTKIRSGAHPSLAYLKVWGYEAYVPRKDNHKLKPKSEKCYFIGYAQKSIGYLFYKHFENNVFVSRKGILP